MADNKISAPMSQTGITRFYDVSSSSIQIDPRIVVGAAVVLIVLVLALEIFA